MYRSTCANAASSGRSEFRMQQVDAHCVILRGQLWRSTTRNLLVSIYRRRIQRGNSSLSWAPLLSNLVVHLNRGIERLAFHVVAAFEAGDLLAENFHFSRDCGPRFGQTPLD